MENSILGSSTVTAIYGQVERDSEGSQHLARARFRMGVLRSLREAIRAKGIPLEEVGGPKYPCGHCRKKRVQQILGGTRPDDATLDFLYTVASVVGLTLDVIVGDP